MLCLSALLLGWDHSIDGFSLFKLLFHFNHQLDTINHQLDLLHFGGAETVSIGDVKHATHRGCVHTTWVEGKKDKKSSFLRMFWDFFDYFSTNESRNANSCCCGTCATFLQTQSGQDFLKLGLSAQLRQLDVHATTQACSKVGRASQDVSQMLVPHETVVVLLKDLLNLAKEMPGYIFFKQQGIQVTFN